MVEVVDEVDLLVAVERLVATHRDELDRLNVFPVPDADTGRNVLATVRAARVAAEQDADAAATAATTAALEHARGNAGVLVSQLLRALLTGDGDWATRLAWADELMRSAVAHPVEGTMLTAVRAAAEAAAGSDGDTAQLLTAVAAAHAAVDATPSQLEVLARAGVVDSGARAAALVLEAVAGVVTGRVPDPPAVDAPKDGPVTLGCDPTGGHRFEVMYLVEPSVPDAADGLREALPAVGDSVVVVAADRLVSVHVHTDDIGGALDAGLAHGRPHHVRVEDLHAGAAAAASRGEHPASGAPVTSDVGLVVGADGVGIARLAARTGATTVALEPGLSGEELAASFRRALVRTRRSRVLLLPGSPAAVAATGALGEDVDGIDVTVVDAVDDPARLLAALAVLDPATPDPDLLGEVAGHVRTGRVDTGGDDAVTALLAIADDLEADGTPELVTLLTGEDVGVALRDVAAARLAGRWPDAEVDVVDAGLRSAVFVVGAE